VDVWGCPMVSFPGKNMKWRDVLNWFV
jgi:hypothetical protein